MEPLFWGSKSGPGPRPHNLRYGWQHGATRDVIGRRRSSARLSASKKQVPDQIGGFGGT